jgi:hypothetical protein
MDLEDSGGDAHEAKNVTTLTSESGQPADSNPRP